jgi:hypothetical protein
MPNWKTNDTAVLAVAVARGGSPVTGLAPTCVLTRLSDGFYYDWAGGWQAPAISTVMPELYTGYYEVTFPQGAAQPNAWETYRAIYQETGAPNKFFRSELHVFRSMVGEAFYTTAVGTVGDALRIIFGMLYDNAMLDETVYGTKGVLLTGRVRLFATPAAAAAATEGAADDAEGEWARFEITATDEASPNEALTQNFKMVRVK